MAFYAQNIAFYGRKRVIFHKMTKKKVQKNANRSQKWSAVLAVFSISDKYVKNLFVVISGQTPMGKSFYNTGLFPILSLM